MKKIVLALVFILQVAWADRVLSTGTVTFLNDYVNRGLSKTNNKPAIQGGLSLVWGHLYTSVVGSNVNMGSVTSEYNIYGGLVGELADGVGFNIGYMRYFYPDNRSYEQEEGYISVMKRFALALNTSVIGFYSPSKKAFTNAEGKISYDFGYWGLATRFGRSLENSEYAKIDYASLVLTTAYILDLDISIGYRRSYNSLDNWSLVYDNYILTIGKSF